MRQAVVITGAGALTCFGVGNEALVQGIGSNADGTGALTLFSSSQYPGKRAGEVRGFDPQSLFTRRETRSCDRVTLLLMAATDILYRELGLADLEKRRSEIADAELGMVIGTMGSTQSIAQFDLETIEEPRYVTPTLFPNTVYCAAASYAAIRRSARESCVTLSNGETSSLQALALGAERVRTGRAKQLIVGGAEELTEYGALFQQARLRREAKEVPVLGEGAVVFSLERQDKAQKRGARQIAEVIAASSAFCPTPQRCYEHNLQRIRELVGEGVLLEVRHVVGAENPELCDRKVLADRVALRELTWQFGYLGGLRGAMGVAAVLADPRIEKGAVILVNGYDSAGNGCSILLRKLQELLS